MKKLENASNRTLDNANAEFSPADPRNQDPKGDFAYRSELEAEIDVLKKKADVLQEYWNKACGDMAKQQDQIAALKAENELLREDAERYRWLRDPKTDIDLVIDKVVEEIPSAYPEEEGIKAYEYRSGEELDVAIDDAMKETK